MSNINSSFSDDGNQSNDLINQIGRRSEDKGYSLQVEFSDRGKQNDYYVNRISEEEFESERERRSSPPGTIGDAQDIMSENIESSLKLLRKKHGLQGQVSAHSQAAGKFDCKIFTSNLDLVIRERIPLVNDNKHMLSFKKCYDRLFKEFKDKLVGEY
jgi:hypothetical protein